MPRTMIQIPKAEYERMRIRAQINNDLLFKLVKGLEDIRLGRIKPWKKIID